MKTFVNWINSYLRKRKPPMKVENLIDDLKDGVRLLALLEVGPITPFGVLGVQCTSRYLYTVMYIPISLYRNVHPDIFIP